MKKQIVAFCPSCRKKNMTHSKVYETYRKGPKKGLKYDAGWKCDECGGEWDYAPLFFV